MSPRKTTVSTSGKTAVTSVDAYIADFPPAIRKRLEQVRATIRKAAPQAEETISYRIPAYNLEGNLIFFAGFVHHIGMYPAPRSSAEFHDELAAYEGGKGTVQFPHDKPLPLQLIRRIVGFRVEDNLGRAAARKTVKIGKSAKTAKTAPTARPAAKPAPKKMQRKLPQKAAARKKR